jgi:hypothetical protein
LIIVKVWLRLLWFFNDSHRSELWFFNDSHRSELS